MNRVTARLPDRGRPGPRQPPRRRGAVHLLHGPAHARRDRAARGRCSAGPVVTSNQALAWDLARTAGVADRAPAAAACSARRSAQPGQRGAVGAGIARGPERAVGADPDHLRVAGLLVELTEAAATSARRRPCLLRASPQPGSASTRSARPPMPRPPTTNRGAVDRVGRSLAACRPQQQLRVDLRLGAAAHRAVHADDPVARRTSTGISVWPGRFPPASTFGDAGSTEKNAPRLCSRTPVVGSRMPAPKP